MPEKWRKTKFVIMKSLFKVVLFLFIAAFCSCGKDEVSSAPSSITSAGMISGTISNYGLLPADSIAFSPEFGSKVTSDGKFSVTLAVPQIYDLKELGTIEGTEVSDPKAMCNNGIIAAIVYLNGQQAGVMMKTNFSATSLSSLGSAFSTFVYCDRNVTIKGGSTENMSEGGYSGTVTSKWDVKYKKGWNEIVMKVEGFSMSGTNIKETISISSIIPTDLKWTNMGNGAEIPSQINKVRRWMIR